MTEESWLGDMAGEAKELAKGSGTGGYHRWSLTGKEAIVEPGHSILIRLLPHPDTFANPKKPNWNAKPYTRAIQHWFDDAEGNRKAAWCPRSFNRDLRCPLCDAAQVLLNSEDADNKKLGGDMRGKDSILWNAVVGSPGDRKLHEDEVDVRLIPLTHHLFVTVSNIMTGGETSEFARGNITRPDTGYELKLSRPATGKKNARWEIECAPKASPAIKGDQEAWRSITSKLRDPLSTLRSEALTPAELFKLFQGEEDSEGVYATSYGDGADEDGDEAAQEAPAASPFPFGDDGDGESGQDTLDDAKEDPPVAPAAKTKTKAAGKVSAKPAAPAKAEEPSGDDSSLWGGFGMPGE